LVDAGMKIAVIERKLFGGTCANTGCIPTKTLVASAYAAKIAHRAAVGVRLGSELTVDMKSLHELNQQRHRKQTSSARSGSRASSRQNPEN
jgi:pyruvate/2-oxoglutarate dehydrogenase complex dihydrolipoamide dehydrogenase (E3) component